LLATLEFRSNNNAFRPVMDALDLLRRYSPRPGQDRWYDEEERVSIDAVVPSEWREAVVDEQERVERIPYELCVLKALRDAIRRREVYVVGGNRWSSSTRSRIASGSWSRCHRRSSRPALSPSPSGAAARAALIA
jgi:hypothetical protein